MSCEEIKGLGSEPMREELTGDTELAINTEARWHEKTATGLAVAGLGRIIEWQ